MLWWFGFIIYHRHHGFLMMHTPIRSLPLRADYDLTTVYGSALHYFAKSVVGEKKNRMPGKVDKPTQNLAI